MKSCLGTLLILLTIVTLVGGGALIWYLSNNSEFTRLDAKAATASPAPAPAPPKPPPHAVPVR